MPLNGRPIPLKNANLTISLQMYNTGTGLPWSNGTLANLTYYVSTEGGTEATSNGTPVQIATNSSLTYCNLTTSEMNGTLVTVRATADNAYAPAVVLYPSNAGADVAVQVAGMNSGVIANATFASGTSIYIDTQKVANNNGTLVLANTTIGTASAVTGNVSLSNTTLSNIANTTFDLANSMGTGWTLRNTISAIAGAVGLSGNLTHASGTSVVFAALDGTSYTLTVAASAYDAPSKLMNRTAIA